MAANAPDARLRVRNATPGPWGGGLYLSESQRTRLLDAAFAIVFEEGYRGMAVRAVSERAGVSSKTFYDLFSDREDCFLAAFDHGVEQLTEVARLAYEAEQDWAASVRAGLAGLLVLLDEEPALCRLVLVEALGVGPRVLAHRAEVSDRVARAVDEGREGVDAAGELPAMTAAGVVGAAFSVIHARLVERDAEPEQEGESERDTGPLIGLLNELMATIVLPYRGRAAATRELTRPVIPIQLSGSGTLPAEGLDLFPADKSRDLPGRGAQSHGPAGRTIRSPLRLTVRRYAALSAVAELCAGGLEPCSREVRGRAGIPYEGQLSRLMMDLESNGLVENTRAGAVGTRKAWRVTSQGQAVLDANRGGRASIKREDRPARKGASVREAAVNGASANRPSAGRAFANGRTPTDLRAAPSVAVSPGHPLGSTLPADFRLTVRTQMALVAVAKCSARGANPSNLEVAGRIGISAKAAVSRMMSRLQEQGLVENTRGKDTKGLEKAWRLTAHGQAVLDAHRPARAMSTDDPAGVRGGKLVPKRGRQAATASGREGASRSRTHRAWRASHTSEGGRRDAPPIVALTASAGVRLTLRTQLVLTAVAEHAGASNRKIAGAAGVRDEGQISKLLARLNDRGLIRDTANPTSSGYARAWQLTPQGEALLRSSRAPSRRAA